jgi:hypothetical protein
MEPHVFPSLSLHGGYTLPHSLWRGELPSEFPLTPLTSPRCRVPRSPFHAVLADVTSWMVLTPPQYYFRSHSHTMARENLGFHVNGSETLDPATGPTRIHLFRLSPVLPLRRITNITAHHQIFQLLSDRLLRVPCIRTSLRRASSRIGFDSPLLRALPRVQNISKLLGSTPIGVASAQNGPRSVDSPVLYDRSIDLPTLALTILEYPSKIRRTPYCCCCKFCAFRTLFCGSSCLSVTMGASCGSRTAPERLERRNSASSASRFVFFRALDVPSLSPRSRSPTQC